MKINTKTALLFILVFSLFFLYQNHLKAQDSSVGMTELLIKRKNSQVIEKISYPDSQTALTALTKFRSDSQIETAQYNYVYQAGLIPNDPGLIEQYYLGQIKAPQAWDKIKASPEVIVAVIDTGVDIYHPDLSSNIWVNENEIKNDKIDNDANGYIDDYQGWDFLLDSPDPRPKFGGSYSRLGINHGTILAGLIGAVGNNNFGISGLSWQVKIMPLRALNSEGIGDTAAVIQAIEYAVQQGADIINLSIVGNQSDSLLRDALTQAYQKGLVITAAAGNESNFSLEEDLDFFPRYPICHDGDNNQILGVGSVDLDDIKSTFSNYGNKCIDIMAPGESFYSTNVFEPVFPDYQKLFGGYWSGTSVATSLVSATAALVKALRPELANYEIYQLIKDNADPIDEKNPIYAGQLGSGRLNVSKTLTAAENYQVSNRNLVLTPQTGHSPNVLVIDSTGQIRHQFLAYDENFHGGVNLTAADIDNDGNKEIITGAGVSGGPHIRVFTKQGELLRQFFAYETTFTGGVNLVAGDVDNDGEVEIITAPQSFYRPLVRVYGPSNEIENEFLVFEENYRGGVNLALSDINGDGQLEIVASRNQGGPPIVKVFTEKGRLIHQFMAYQENFSSGLKVTAANLYSDKRTEFIIAPASNFKPHVKIFSPSGNLEYQWLAWEEDNSYGLNISVGNIDSDNQLEVAVARRTGSNSEVKIFDFKGGFKNSFTAFEDGFYGGINLGL